MPSVCDAAFCNGKSHFVSNAVDVSETKRLTQAQKILIEQRQPHYHKNDEILGCLGEAYNIGISAIQEKLDRLKEKEELTKCK